MLAAAALATLLSGCAGDSMPGIWPKDPLPPAQPGGPAPFPTFHSPNPATDEERGLLTPLEVQELEGRLARQAVTRQEGVEKRIDGSSKAKPTKKSNSSKTSKKDAAAKTK